MLSLTENAQCTDTFNLCLSAGKLKSQMSTLSSAHKDIIT